MLPSSAGRWGNSPCPAHRFRHSPGLSPDTLKRQPRKMPTMNTPLTRRNLLAACALMFATPKHAASADNTPPPSQTAGAPKLHLPKPGEHDACPVCGMFPARYYEWIATIVFKDGTAVHFDGAKDAFKFWLDMKKYDPKGHTQADVKAFGVTAYYSTEMIDARKALYVIGSDVIGPMGHDLIPHPDMYDAKAFMKDHHGKAIVHFEDIDMQMLLGLDRGEFIVHGRRLK